MLRSIARYVRTPLHSLAAPFSTLSPTAMAERVHALRSSDRAAGDQSFRDALENLRGIANLAEFGRNLDRVGQTEMARQAFEIVLARDDVHFEARTYLGKEDDWRFVFTTECLTESPADLALCRDVIRQIAAVIDNRRERETAGRLKDGDMPAAAWRIDLPLIREADDSVSTLYSTARDVLAGEETVLKALRLYCMQFTGYQVATLGWWHERPWFKRTDPGEVAKLQAFLARRNDPKPLREYSELVVGIPDRHRLGLPKAFGEAGWQVGSKLISPDLILFQDVVSTLSSEGVLDILATLPAPAVIEIGGGYGGLAYFLSGILGCRTRYIIVDLPESLLFSATYLRVMRPDVDHRIIKDEEDDWGLGTPGFTFVPNYLARSEPAARCIDFAINTRSMDEMASGQVQGYARMLADWLKPDGLFFDKNTNAIKSTLAAHLNLQACLSEPNDELRIKRLWSIQGRTSLWDRKQAPLRRSSALG